MPIDPERRAHLAAQVSTLSSELAGELKHGVQQACGQRYSDMQAHAWGMCSCAQTCPSWVEAGFVAAEAYVVALARKKSALQERPDLSEVLDETALEMTGLLRNVVLDDEEIKSSKQAEQGDVFASSEDKTD